MAGYGKHVTSVISILHYPPESLNSNTIMTEQITFPEKGHINNWQTIIN
nr:MAG TPA: hypothetical protein [Caudoviricetes sp.]